MQPGKGEPVLGAASTACTDSRAPALLGGHSLGSGCPRSPYPWWLCRSHSQLAPNRLETHLAQPNRPKEHHTCNLIKGSFKGACPSGL